MDRMQSMAKPPNLKTVGKCTKYDYPVSDDDVCDSWEAGELKDATKRAWSKHRKRIKELSNG
jgi:hypothetical protein